MNGAQGVTSAQPRKQTELEGVCERLSVAVGMFKDNNDAMAYSLSHFRNEPQPPGAEQPANKMGPAEPIPGTLGALSMLLDRLSTEVERQGSFRANLAAVF